MDDKVLKHLEFIQNTINRMSTNSFLIKGWAIALVGIIIGLNKLEGNYVFESRYNLPIEMVVILLLIFLFWFTNAYFLQQERRYIYIYSKTIELKKDITLSMNYADYVPTVSSKCKNIVLKALIILFIVVAIVSFLFIDSFFLKVISAVVLSLASLFTVTYLIPTKYFCQYWTCVIGRTIISVYGTMIVLLLLINHSRFNT